jgi:hypothetical protein
LCAASALPDRERELGVTGQSAIPSGLPGRD